MKERPVAENRKVRALTRRSGDGTRFEIPGDCAVKVPVHQAGEPARRALVLEAGHDQTLDLSLEQSSVHRGIRGMSAVAHSPFAPSDSVAGGAAWRPAAPWVGRFCRFDKKSENSDLE